MTIVAFAHQIGLEVTVKGSTITVLLGDEEVMFRDEAAAWDWLHGYLVGNLIKPANPQSKMFVNGLLTAWGIMGAIWL